MSASSRIGPCDIVVFGGTGDLALRKLIPALYLRDRDGLLPRDTRIIGVSRAGLEDVGYRVKISGELGHSLPPGTADPRAVASFVRRLHHITLDVGGRFTTEEQAWRDLVVALADSGRTRVFYLACAPDLFGPICRSLRRWGLINSGARVVLEKPIGHDLASARRINDEVASAFAEDRTFRIDHYLGTETVQNLLTLRFANALFEPLWNSAAIDHVQITVSESLGVGGRVGYYDDSGTARDMLQNHLLQLLCLVAMEPPIRLDPEAVRDRKLEVLRALAPLTGAEVARATVRGQYTAGIVDDRPVPGYTDELGGRPSDTETFVACKAEIRNWRWAGVPFYLRTGKRLDRHAAEIVVQLRGVPHSIFPGVSPAALPPNRLVLRLQPDEGVELQLVGKQPGPGDLRLQPVPISLGATGRSGLLSPGPYARLLGDVLRGDPTLFMRRDEVEAAWAWVQPILTAWSESGSAPLHYAAGTPGPAAADELVARDGRGWV
ncbi:glucose-6-phosphate dehydrogenase [Nocardia sp. alder85J]|uniref:glucose-6-phosphate dehydrogenase n=1 Tax=Nocardia sp. alder85J TaxID=2862949 RepID=UPI001CD7A02A|nr:glucose-6-phosphate dehydrogenase [Nocardia sp. alder85J]MCX4098249.1 glucose-6-phosphate dehydrogenase [Nocardia sp. alder85J]